MGKEDDEAPFSWAGVGEGAHERRPYYLLMYPVVCIRAVNLEVGFHLGVTQTLVDYAVGLRYEDIPTDVVEKAKACLLDSLGCGFGGYRTELGRIVIDQVKEMGGARQATLLGDGGQVPCAQAAFTNAALVNALDYDETFVSAGHLGSTLIPAAIAVGEHLRVSGAELIEAIVAAYEVNIRIGTAIQPSPERFRQVWFVGTHQTFGAVTAAGKLLGLDNLQMADAFGIAGVTSPLPNSQAWGHPQHWVKEPTAWPAHSGVLAAQLAKRGFIGNRKVLEGENGFWIMAGSDRCNFDVMVEGLGRDYRLLDMSFKPYPSCRMTHSALDAVRDLVNTHKITPGQVRNVVVKISSALLTQVFEDYTPTTFVDAEFSIPYVTAMVLMGIDQGPNGMIRRRCKIPKF